MAKPDKSADVLLEALSLALLNWSLRQERKAGELSGTPASVTSHCDILLLFCTEKHTYTCQFKNVDCHFPNNG